MKFKRSGKLDWPKTSQVEHKKIEIFFALRGEKEPEMGN